MGTQTVLRNIQEARNLLEHRQLPNYLYKTKKDSVKSLLSITQNLAYSTFKNNCEENSIDFPYDESDFTAKSIDLKEGLKAVKLTLPEPTDEGECYSVYFVYTYDCSKMYYFTVEKELHQGEQYLGGWTKKAHFNHGLVGEAEDAQIEKLIHVFETSPIINR